MIVNEDTVLIGSKIVLVPYLKDHVAKYHEWMQSKELQELTASEPLSIEEEYAMQASWHQDADKLTFIILSEKAYANGPASDVVSSMIGDVNVFLINHNDQKAAEVEVMIAEPEARGKGYGREAIRMMLAYAYRELGLTYFVVKIGLANTTSARLFKSLLFVQESVSEAFQEVTMVMDMSTSTVPRNLTTYSQRSLKERLAKDTLAAENE